MAETLVIVESPAKAKTIAKYLGKGFKVRASVGHVVDLPKKSLGVDIQRDFHPTYEVMPEKKKVVAELKQAAQGIREIILAPDPDREGEAIAWHIADLLAGKDRRIRRMLINEITKTGVQQALASAGELNRDLFDAQQARRILDRLVGYQISPLLYRTLRRPLSAGRVQSVAVRLVVDRENAIRAFKEREYWSIEAQLSAKLPPEFKARLVAIEGKAIELPEKFDRESNAYIPIDQKKNTYIPNEVMARSIQKEISNRPFIVAEVNRNERKRNAPPPFITSTLQQDAVRKLRITAKQTMSLAQRLYEGVELGDEGAVGLITYMRTDSTRVSAEAQQAARRYIVENFGPDYLPAQPNVFSSKKGAQDAHEAIRPTDVSRTPESMKPFLEGATFKLYELIYQRFLASQMKPAVYDQTAVEIPVDKYHFRANGRVIKFKGFLAAYEESKEEDSENGENFPLPPLEAGDQLQVKEINLEKHATKPPPRFTEASLVKELEERGIGRPSTYAAILSTIQDRDYVTKDKSRRFLPTPTGEMITQILLKSFPEIMDFRFTAQMEEDLDRVEDGHLSWQKLLHQFYPPFAQQLAHAAEVIKEIRAVIPTDLSCPKCNRELVIKWGKNGEFLGCSGYPDCDYTSEFVREEGNGVKPREKEETAIACPSCGKPMLVKQSKRGEFLGCSGYPECKQTLEFLRAEEGRIEVIQPEPEHATCDLCGKPMVVKKGRYGPFLACTGYPECRNIKNLKGEARRPSGRGTGLQPVAAEGEPPCEKCGKPMVIRQGKWGPFLSCSGYPQCKNIRRKGKPAEDSDKTEVKTGSAPAAKKASRSKAAAASVTDAEAPCEKCGKPMVIRPGKWGPFLSCSGFPQCKNIRKLPKEKLAELAAAAGISGPGQPAAPKKPAEPAPEGEPPCELCGKPMVVRQGKWGPFLGCSGYPKCKNIRKKNS